MLGDGPGEAGTCAAGSGHLLTTGPFATGPFVTGAVANGWPAEGGVAGKDTALLGNSGVARCLPSVLTTSGSGLMRRGLLGPSMGAKCGLLQPSTRTVVQAVIWESQVKDI